jgi:HEPN domain-containing protein
MTAVREEAERLLRMALRDANTFALLMPLSQADLAAVGFHAQQAIGKALKAVAVCRGIALRRTHDLTVLAAQLSDAGVPPPVPVDGLRKLNPFAVEFRYDDLPVDCMRREELNPLLHAILDWAGEIIGGMGGDSK